MKHKERHEMHDNRKIKDTHQEGIGRVLMRKGDLQCGQPGKMSWKGDAPHHSEHGADSFKRGAYVKTPRRG